MWKARTTPSLPRVIRIEALAKSSCRTMKLPASGNSQTCPILSHVRRKIAQSEKLRQVRSGRTPVERVRNVYLTILSREPTAEELLVLRDYGESGRVKRWEVMVDLPWALVNSAEFLYKH